MKYYIKIITGFRDDQFVTVPMQEAHKAYYLFRHPDERGVFEDGSAIIGKNIQEIRPDYNSTMGWLSTHHIDSDDLIELRDKKIDLKMRELIQNAKDVADLISKSNKQNLLGSKLQELLPLVVRESNILVTIGN